MANTLDELMRDAAKILTGPHDRRIEDIVKYYREELRMREGGKKARRSEVSEEISPQIRAAFEKRLPPKKTYRRF
jgi:hypothetical protein